MPKFIQLTYVDLDLPFYLNVDKIEVIRAGSEERDTPYTEVFTNGDTDTPYEVKEPVLEVLARIE